MTRNVEKTEVHFLARYPFVPILQRLFMDARKIISLVLLTAIAGCASPRQAIVPPQPKPRGADPQAMGHFIDAKRFELAGQREDAVKALRAAIAIDSTAATLYSSLARNLISLNRIAEAGDVAREAVRLEPRAPAHRWLLYDALVKGQRDSLLATAQLEAVTRLNPADFRAYAQLLQIYTARRQRQEVLRVLDRAASVPAPNLRYDLLIADGYQRLNLPRKAAGIYRRILHRDPEQAQIWNRLGDLTIAGGDTLGAAAIYRTGLAHFQHRLNRTTQAFWQKLIAIYDREDHMEALVSETPPDTLFLDRLSAHLPRSIPSSGADRVLVTRRYRHTEALLDRLIGELPERHDLLGRKALVLLDDDRPEEARRAFRKAISLDPDPWYRLGVARSYMNERNWEPAIEILVGLFDGTPAESGIYPRIVFALGGAYALSDRTAQARQVYSRAVDARPDEFRYQLAVGRTYLAEKKWEEAILALENLKSRLQDDWELLEDVLFDLGHSYERAGRFDSAVAVFQRLLARSPDNHKALNYLGYMFAEKGIRLGEAEDYITRALKGDPNNGAYLDSMGWVYFQQRRYDEAMKTLKLALTVEESRFNEIEVAFRTAGQRENLSIILDHVGDAARALGNIEEAVEHWQRAADLNPGNESIQRKLQSFGPNRASGP